MNSTLIHKKTKISYIKCYSDLHLEFADFEIEESLSTDKETLLILAGDINVEGKAVNFISRYVERYAGIVYVLGNHEHYHGEFNSTLNVIDKELDRVLANKDRNKVKTAGNSVKTFYYDGVRVIAGTMWSDFYGGDIVSMQNIRRYMNDFRIIRNGESVLTPQDVLEVFKESVKDIEWELRKEFDGVTIVVSHHMPSMSLISERFKYFDERKLNGGFASDLDRLIELYEPDFWICGHSHDSVDEFLFKTHVINNSRGYPRRFSYEDLDDPKVFENVKFNSLHFQKIDVKFICNF